MSNRASQPMRPLLLPAAIAVGVLAECVVLSAAMPVDAAQALEQRVADRRIVERFYWSHREWPAHNPGAKPPFELAVSAELVRRHTADALLETAALERLWGVRIGPHELQRELERTARNTRDPERLRALWRLLGNDPDRIAEAVARPLLADRLLRARYAWDRELHAETAARAREALAARGGRVPTGQYREQEVRLGAEESGKERDPVRALGRRGWTLDRLPLGRWSDLLEDSGRFYSVTVLERSAERVRIGSVSWSKQPFDAWWGAIRDALSGDRIERVHGLTLPAIPRGTQAVDTWVPMDPDGPLARSDHSAVWTGAEMIVWGGHEANYLADGARYDPATDSWSAMTTLGAPAARVEHFAFWTGSEMLVWGGSRFGVGDAGAGGRYDPTTDTWQPMNDVGAPVGLYQPSAVWTGSQLIVWGGYDNVLGAYIATGARYAPGTDTWSPTSTTGAPSPRSGHAAVWSGTRMIVWGGYDESGLLGSGSRYHPANDTWTATSTSGIPSPRYAHGATWDGTFMLVWGGFDADGYAVTGGRYRLQTNQWSGMAAAGAPTGRELQTMVWTGSRLVVWGGFNDNGYVDPGGRYDSVADAWEAVTDSAAPVGRTGHTAVWTGTEMLVWGGGNDSGLLDTGGRYDPTGDAWQPVAEANGRTDARGDHVSVWTGSELITWGGGYLAPLDGGRYDPVTDAWTPMNVVGAPADRIDTTAVWTGEEMIVWGGNVYDPDTGGSHAISAGGRYEPATDSWTATNVVGEPTPRGLHTSVWTGTEMIVWGGTDPSSGLVTGGGRYDPATDHWIVTGSAKEPSPRYLHTAIWTGSEMIIFGGGGGAVDLSTSGARYRPDLDLWRRTSETGVTGRLLHSAAWTGSEMIVWGGSDDDGNQDGAGGRYDPQSDEWRPIPATAEPAFPGSSKAVWTCGSLLAWGPDALQTAGSGARYDLATNTWAPMSTLGAPLGTYELALAARDTSLLLVGGVGPLGTPTATGGIYRVCETPLELGSISGLSLARGAAGTRIAWHAAPTETGYDLVRGDLFVLRATGGDFSAATETCLLSNGAQPWADDAAPLPSDAAFWYLARPRRGAEIGSYDSGGLGQNEPRDPGIAASGVGCP